jgi:thiol:disulfide interchange protein DsbD
MKLTVFAVLFFTVFTFSFSQVLDPVKWEVTSEKLSKNIYELRFEAKIDKGWHIYGLNLPQGGPLPTTFIFENEKDINFLSGLESMQKSVMTYDSTFEMQVELFDTKALFVRKIGVNEGDSLIIKGVITFMACDNSKCLPPKEIEFSLMLSKYRDSQIKEVQKEFDKAAAESSIASAKDQKSVTTSLNISNEIKQDKEEESTSNINEKTNTRGNINKKSLLGLFILALIAGFGALLTPCVYPVIPLTVSFFMRDKSRSNAIFNGIFFGLSIVFIYTLVGLFTGLFRIDLVRLISSHWLPNLIFFIIFLALAFSFFGLFEITLPGRLSNKIDRRADRGGIFGPFFMALTTVIISSSCTGPIVGIVLGGAMQGEIIRPLLGMFGFSLSFALPFTLLAIFPGFIKKLPKSGSWLNSVKVFFAFILLAFSLVFLANLGLKFITRDVILSFAIAIFFLLGMYLLGKIKLPHDSDLNFVSLPRLLLAIASFSFAIYMIPGLFGAPLKTISPFLPSKEEMSFDLTRSMAITGPYTEGVARNNICTEKPKYSDILHLPLELKGYFDYQEALNCARELKKPVLLDFAGHSCKNCKKMYAEVWSDPRVMEKLKNDFVIAVLYTDDRTIISKEDFVVSKVDGKVKNTIGKKFNNLQIEKFGSNALPLYAIVDFNGKVLTDQDYYEYNPSIEAFIRFLENGLTKYSSN